MSHRISRKCLVEYMVLALFWVLLLLAKAGLGAQPQMLRMEGHCLPLPSMCLHDGFRSGGSYEFAQYVFMVSTKLERK